MDNALSFLLESSANAEPTNPKHAVELFTRAVLESKHAAAMLYLGWLHLHGEDRVPRNSWRALELLNLSIDDSPDHSAAASYFTAIFLESGDGNDFADYEYAADLYSGAVHQAKDPNSMVRLASLYRFGNGVFTDPPMAVQLLETAIDEVGHVEAMVDLASILENGEDDVEEDRPRAVELLTRALAESGSASIMVKLGLLLEREGPCKDLVRAVSLYESAVLHERDSNAMYYLARQLEFGGTEGVLRDLPRALKLYRSAAYYSGHANAILRLANILLRDGKECVEKDALFTTTICGSGLEEGFEPWIANALGKLHHEGGENCPRSITRAVELYECAISRSFWPSAFNLACIFGSGDEEGHKSPSKAAKLFALAIEACGDSDAMLDLVMLLMLGSDDTGEDRDLVRKLLERAVEDCEYMPSMYCLGAFFEKCQSENTASFCEESTKYSFALLLLNETSTGVLRDPVRAVMLLSDAVEMDGHADSMYELAMVLNRGDYGVRRDPLRCVELLLRAFEESEHRDSLHFLAAMLEHGGVGVPKDVAWSVYLYNMCIERHDCCHCMHNLAVILQDGNEAAGIPKNAPRAAELYGLAASISNDAISLNNYAILLEEGDEGVPKDSSLAVTLYLRAFEASRNPIAMVNLAGLLRNGADDLGKDVDAAIRLLSDCVEKHNHIGAMYELARILDSRDEGEQAVDLLSRVIAAEPSHEDAIWVLAQILNHDEQQRDAERAAQLYTELIEEANNTKAVYELAYMLSDMDFRKGAQMDLPRSVELYEKFILESEDDIMICRALSDLGFILSRGGDGVKKDSEQAAALYRKAISMDCDSESVTPMYRLASLLEFGDDGVPPEPELAACLYQRYVDLALITMDPEELFDRASWLEMGSHWYKKDAIRAKLMYEGCLASFGFAPARDRLIQLHLHGADGVPPDPDIAKVLEDAAIEDSCQRFDDLLISDSDDVSVVSVREVFD